MRENCIGHFIHCTMCMDEMPGDRAPGAYARLNVGFTRRGLQVWCVRHDANVVHIDFEGARHPAEVDAAVREGGR